MRLLKFLGVGTVVGGALAGVLGYAFSSGFGDTLMFELGVYIVCGIIAGFFTGFVAHVLTYRPASETGAQSHAEAFWGSKSGAMGIAGGVVFTVVSVLWFFAGIAIANRIYFYPIVLFVVGLIALASGLLSSKR